MRRFAFAAALFLSLLPAAAYSASRAEVEIQFQRWIADDLSAEAKQNGISDKTIAGAFKGVSLNWDLPDLVPPGSTPPPSQDQSQAEFSSPGAYFSEKRLQGLAATGRSLAAQHRTTLERIEATYGVPGEVIIAIWGRESGFGRAKLPYSAIEVLATKAFMSTRKEMFRSELIAALHMIEGGDITASKMMGSWAGALGQPQFLPSSYLKYAVDFDRDGHRDIWNSVPDSLASIANYLARPISSWENTGISRVSGRGFPEPELRADGMMLVPAGRHGPQFIVTPNFYVLKQYNNSDLYALFIGNLADRIAYGSRAFQAPWGDVGRMKRSDVLAMQKALVAQGYDVGKVDGLAGYKTRRSIGDWQAKNGLAATCFPSASLKDRLK